MRDFSHGSVRQMYFIISFVWLEVLVVGKNCFIRMLMENFGFDEMFCHNFQENTNIEAYESCRFDLVSI